MITLFTTAKPFEGKWAVLQRNAIRSWRCLAPDVEIILFGRGGGYEEAAGELGITHRPDVATNEKGIPRVDAMFRDVDRSARHAIRAYLNCDVILLDDFPRAAARVPFNRFLMVSQRWDLAIDGPFDFEAAGWSGALRQTARTSGELQYPGAIDLFAWRGPVWDQLPPMVVGRGLFDQWLIYDCRRRGVPVVDATDVVTLVHQAHDYSHIDGGKKTVELGEDALRNLELGGGYERMFTVQDADWRLTRGGMIRNWYRGDSQRCREVFLMLHERCRQPWLVLRAALAELACEWVTRWREARAGRMAPLLKLPLWLARRAVGARAKGRSAA